MKCFNCNHDIRRPSYTNPKSVRYVHSGTSKRKCGVILCECNNPKPIQEVKQSNQELDQE